MASQNPQGGQGLRSGAHPSSNAQSSLLEKTRAGAARRSTPDSEALASSDDEHDFLSQSMHSITSNNSNLPRSTRRSSWLSELQPNPQRKLSFTGTALSSNNSQPTTPSGEGNPWGFGSTLGRVTSNNTTTGWGQSSIWSDATRREAAARFGETAGSPTALHNQSRSLMEGKQSCPTGLRDLHESAFPFTIPLHPTPKTYRSQSYSVGQMEEEINNSTGQASAATQQRPRPGQLSAVRHRPSRPSLLSEVSSENTTLGQLREVDDDEISATGSDQGVRLQNNALRNELVDTGHNSLLRQAAFENARMRQRAATGTTSFSGDLRFSIPTMSDAIAGAGTESAIDEGGDLTQPGEQSRILNRRFSEVAGPLPLFPEEPLRAEDTKRAHWQSSLDFGTIGEDTQSRRNSFAGIPTRRGSLVPAFGQESSTITPSFGGLGGPGYLASSGATEVPDMRESHQHPQLPTIAPQAIEKRYSENRAYARTYFSGVAPAVRSTLEMTAGPLPPYHPSGTYRHGPASSVFSRPGQDAPLYIVSFKCARADAFYVAEGTGLQVKEGDLVIVEADRGHDLGTVLHARVSWSRARELKEQAAEEHYRWLMMFSRHNQTIKSDTVNPNGMMASSSTRRGSMGVPETGHGSDLKPKMIKRLAQPHEIATLRDKEGNEAKAKRVCQQKVNEHRLSMEILDAEFQMDWKKLTFYYFAETYINFNPLVTELFKIYKTRIWMSAINPASFASNALQPPSGVGPGALQGRDTPMDNSRPGLIGGIAPGQDPDPLGAIPPSQNPTTNSYQQLMLARQQFQQEQQARVYGQYSQANQMQPFTSTSATTATGQTPDSFNFGSIMTGSTNNGLASQSLQGQYGAQPSYGVSNTGYPLSMTAAMAPTMYGVNTPSPSSASAWSQFAAPPENPDTRFTQSFGATWDPTATNFNPFGYLREGGPSMPVHSGARAGAGPDATGPARNRPKPAKDSDWFARFSNLNLEPKKD